MAIKNSLDVLVVGAGPIGLFCANELSRHGLTCRIVDKKSGSWRLRVELYNITP